MSPAPPVTSFALKELYSAAGRSAIRMALPALPVLALLTCEQVWYTSRIFANGGLPPLEALGIQLLFATTVGVAAYAALFRLALDGFDGRPDLAGALGLAWRRYPAALGTGLLLALATGLGALLCLAPGVFLAVAFAVAFPIVLEEGVGPIEALRRSWRRTAGNRALVFVAFLLLFLGLFVVVAVWTLVVEVSALPRAPAVSAADTLRIAEYVAIGQTVLGGVFTLPFMGLVAALHRRLAPGPAAPAPTAPAEAWTAPPSP